VNGVISGKIHFEAGSTGVENLGINVGGQNMLRNSAFTGDYLSESLNNDVALGSNSQMFSDPFWHWQAKDARVVESDTATAGYECVLNGGSLLQEMEQRMEEGEQYIFSFKAKGQRMTYAVGGVQKTIPLTDKYERYIERFIATTQNKIFRISNADATICDLQLEKGNVVSEWGRSILDNQSSIARYQSLNYLEAALKGSTDVIGGLVLSNLIMLGNPGKNDNTAGVSGIYNSEEDIAFWGGGTFAQALATVMKYVDDPTYQPTEAEMANMAKAVITHGGRAILNDAILRGKVYASGGVFNGSVYATDGVFSGFVKSKMTEINSSNQTEYLTTSPWYGTQYIDIQKAGGYLKVTSPLDYVIALWGTRFTTDMQQVEQIRSLVGTKCTIVNATDEDLPITGDTGRDGTYFSTKLGPHEVIYFECKAIVDANGEEQIYWEVDTRAKVKSTFSQS
jgi:hypothetical protein